MNSPIPAKEITGQLQNPLNALMAVNMNDAANAIDIAKVCTIIEDVNARKLLSKASNFSALTDKLVLHGFKVSMPTNWRLEVSKVSERTGFADFILSVE